MVWLIYLNQNYFSALLEIKLLIKYTKAKIDDKTISPTRIAAASLPSDINFDNGIRLAKEIKVKNTAMCAINLLLFFIPLLHNKIRNPIEIGIKGVLLLMSPENKFSLASIKPQTPRMIKVNEFIKLAILAFILFFL